ncbi:MAG: bifunctional YncE family protein/alkaline phosphatase family protein [Silvibacterium sp.]
MNQFAGRPLAVAAFACIALSAAASGQTINLPTSKQLLEPVPGSPQSINNLPISMAVSPDSQYVVTVNAGYGSFDSRYMQSLTVLDTKTGKVSDFPDNRTFVGAKQTLYSGLAFSRDGRELYASMDSLTDPLGHDAPDKENKDTGSGIAVYSFHDGKIAPLRMMKIPLQQLAPGRHTKLIGEVDGNQGVPYPASIAVIGDAGHEHLLIADNLSDDALLMDASTGAILHRFDLSESDAIPGTYPIAVAATKDGVRAFVALWNASEIIELDLANNTIGRKLPLLRPRNPTVPGTHPCAFALSPDERTLYIALSNRDAVAAVNIAGDQFSVKGYYDTRLPHQSYFGAEPDALAVSADGRHLYAANMASDAVAVIDTTKLTPRAAKKGMVEPIGFIPTEWMPVSMALNNGQLYVATDKGHGTGPNNFPQRQTPDPADSYRLKSSSTYIATLLRGSLATLDTDAASQNLQQSTEQVLESNRMKAAQEKIAFTGSSESRIKHVIYIIKENRTYDQLFGDLTWNGKTVGNGDPSLTMYGADITPNQHKLALQFGVLDNFFDSGEVSGDGHVWSNAAIGTDYLEKTWQQAYRGGERTYDYEGVVAEGYPILQNIADVNEPASGYLWGDLARHGKTLYHFGEYISSIFCNDKNAAIAPKAAQQGPMTTTEAACNPKQINPGDPIPAAWGGGISKWPWPIPLVAQDIATKPQLVGHFAPEYPDFNLDIPDQLRANIFLRHLKGWIADRERGNDTMPNFVMLRFADDHTAGTTPGGPTPRSSVADNDLAIGRAIDAVSHSPYWDDTAFFILEDDAQNGADHVDAHRSMALIISKYAPRASDSAAPNTAGAPFAGAPFIDSRFYSTVSMLRTMESVLGLPPMNNNDAFSSLMAPEFSGPGTQPPFTADYTNETNGLICQANPPLKALGNTPAAQGERESAKMDFTHADRADPQKLNIILWQNAKGNAPIPAELLVKHRKAKKDDDD